MTTGRDHKNSTGTHPSDAPEDSVVRRYNVKVRGQGKTTLVMAHGLGCDLTIWNHIIPAFEQDYRIVLFDFTGAGQSYVSQYDPKQYSTLDGYVADLLQICTALDLQDIIYIGHSVAGAIGLLASIQAPDRFARLVTIGASPRYLNELPRYYGGFDPYNVLLVLDAIDNDYANWAAGMATTATGESGIGTVHKNLLRRFLSAEPRYVSQFARATFYCDVRDQLKSVLCPVVVIQSTTDAIVPLEAAMMLSNGLPQSRLMMLDIEGHYPQLANPAKLVELLNKAILVDVPATP